MDPKACYPLFVTDDDGLFLIKLNITFSVPVGSSDEQASLLDRNFHPGVFVAVVLILVFLQIGAIVLLYAAACLKHRVKPVVGCNNLVRRLNFDVLEMTLILVSWAALVTYLGAHSFPRGFYPEPERENTRKLPPKLVFELLVTCLPLATIAVVITYQAAGMTKWKHSRYQRSNKFKNPALSREESNKQRLANARAVVRSWRRFICTAGTGVMCTLQNLYEPSGVPAKAQAGVSRDSESTSTGSYIETEPENSSGSDSRVTKHDDGINAVAKTAATWLVASAATHHATGNGSILSGFRTVEDGPYLEAGDGMPMLVRGRGAVITDTVVLPDVWFVPGLVKNIVSASQLIELDYSIVFTHGVCYIRRATDGTVIGKACVGDDGMFELEFLKVPLLN
ncbi:hypothetical protein ACQ4PT_063164 [Festuca glaucescens]